MYIWVCASNQNHSSCNSPIVVTPQGVEFPCIVLEFQEYYNEECMSYSKHYYYLHEVYNNIPPYTKIVLKIGAVS